jgi:hypothetical protein
LNFELFLLRAGLDQQRVAEIIIVQMKRNFVVAIAVSLNRLSNRNPGILNQHLNLRTPLAIPCTYEPFDREPVIGFMCGKQV